MSEFFTPRQVARALGVSESSLKRWCDQTLLKIVRTAGGHRRVPYEEVARFCRETGRTLAAPQVLGLPAAVGHGATVYERAGSQFAAALVAGDEATARRIAVDLFLTKHPIWEIGDMVIAPALAEVGAAWQCGEVAVWQERRGCEIVQRVIYELMTMMVAPRADAPRAFGATLEGDPYRLSTTLCEATLREAGWQAESFGTSIPIASLGQALIDLKPTLAWISVSHIAEPEVFVDRFNELSRRVNDAGIALAVGGRAIDDSLAASLECATRCRSLAELRGFASSLVENGSKRSPARRRKKQSPPAKRRDRSA